ncbi:MAG: BamA/TamA family outer membrane protein [Gemmatimonadales bacterium]|jgi:hypothetical protein
MNVRRSLYSIVLLAMLAPATASAQDWNNQEALAIVRRAVERRATAHADGGLRDYRARAHGFVFFLGQLGELSEPPRLIKSDQLELEVYWKAPGISKQRIIGWRDRADLPTDIRYHRDHLGIVTDNFGDRIGLGHDQEVHDVPHPLSRAGVTLYDYALVDSQTVQLPQRTVRVYLVRARPKDMDAARVVGTLYIDVETGELVRFRFNFTRGAYVDDTLEDITILLENSLWDGRYWLPIRQEIEIRRRTSWLDLPARGIIRGRWEIDSYEFNVSIPEVTFRGPTIVAAPATLRDTFQWEGSIDNAIRQVSDPALTVDLEEVRAEVRQLAEDRVLTGLAISKPGVSSVSEIVHFNRVEGLAAGAGWVFRPGGGAFRVDLWGGYGFRDQKAKGRIQLGRRLGRVTIGLQGEAVTRDVGDEMVISPLLNSLLAEEVGNDFGDYYFVTKGAALVQVETGARSVLEVTAGVEHSSDLVVRATPAAGEYRENPALGAGTLGVGTLSYELRSAGFAMGNGLSGRIRVEGGLGEQVAFLRVLGSVRAQFPVGRTDFAARFWGGVGSEELPANRSFVMGGRGTLIPDPFRAWGGRSAAFGLVELRIPVPFPTIPLGAFSSTGNRVTVAPNVALGWTGWELTGTVPWEVTGGVRAVVGLGIEWFHNLFRVDFGLGLEDSEFGVVFDVNRGLWGIL